MESGKQSVTAFENPENRALRQTWIFGSGSRYAIRPCCDLTHASPRSTRPAHTPISHCSRQVFAVAVTEGFRQPFHSSAHSGRLTIRSVTSAYPSPTEGSYPESAAAGALGNTNAATAFHALGSDHISGSHYQGREEEFDRQRGQWSGPRDHRRAGDQDPMSQKGPVSGSTSPVPQLQQPQESPTATNTASRVCSVSPRNLEEAARRAESSAVAAAASDAAAALETQHLYHRHRHSLGTPTTNGERVHHSPQRSSLGVHHILNPAATEPRSGSPGPGTPTSAVARSIEDERLGGRYNPAVSSQQGSNPSTPQLYTPRPYGLAGPPQQQQQSQQQQQQHQQSENSSNMATLGSMLHHRSLSTGRQSPASSPSMHPFPSMGAATRRILTPQSPRALSMGGGRGPPPPNRPLISSPAPLLHHQPPPPPPSSAGLEMRRQVSIDSFSDQRSNYTHGAPPQHQHHPLAPRNPLRTTSRPLERSPSQQQGYSLLQTIVSNSTSSTARNRRILGREHRYSSSHSSYGGGSSPRAIPVPEGQLAFRIAPVNGEVFTIPVDTHQASRASDEKRQRNAGASARFRLRKKEREQQQVMNLQKLQQDNAEMQKRLQELEEIEIERNRLRDIVWRTQQSGGPAGSTATSEPSGYHHQRQPSPPRRRHAESLSVGGVPPPPPIPSGAYGAGDPVTGERPSRRRRTDSGLEFAPVPPPSQHHQAQGPPHALPSPLSYAGAPLSQPGTPTGLRPTTRLPPLRMDHQSSEAQHRPPSEPGSATTQQSQQGYSPYKREPYESGWAVRPGGGGPHDPNQKGA
ncbi:uncharacterized protein PG986_014808 [Apiospora aurea]|uniref:BZIP domain-containing protein n=1 Tax=Apiospora aurea TaxID=335848 RepID=A0ABR1PU22_9PEZI